MIFFGQVVIRLVEVSSGTGKIVIRREGLVEAPVEIDVEFEVRIPIYSLSR